MMKKLAVALVACTCLTAPALAQEPTPSERAQMEAELRQLNAMKVDFDRRIRNLEQRLGTSPGAAGTAATAAAAAPPARPAPPSRQRRPPPNPARPMRRGPMPKRS